MAIKITQAKDLPAGFDDTFRARFESKVNKDGAQQPHCIHLGNCWTWTGGTDPDGYGITSRGGRNTAMRANRAAWLLEHGNLPSKAWVLHKCDNPSCVRPDHLFLGDATTNAQDRADKNRSADLSGEQHPKAKITFEIAQQIRARHIPHVRGAVTLAREFGISKSIAERVLANQRYVA